MKFGLRWKSRFKCVRLCGTFSASFFKDSLIAKLEDKRRTRSRCKLLVRVAPIHNRPVARHCSTHSLSCLEALHIPDLPLDCAAIRTTCENFHSQNTTPQASKRNPHKTQSGTPQAPVGKRPKVSSPSAATSAPWLSTIWPQPHGHPEQQPAAHATSAPRGSGTDWPLPHGHHEQ